MKYNYNVSLGSSRYQATQHSPVFLYTILQDIISLLSTSPSTTQRTKKEGNRLSQTDWTIFSTLKASAGLWCIFHHHWNIVSIVTRLILVSITIIDQYLSVSRQLKQVKISENNKVKKNFFFCLLLLLGSIRWKVGGW